MTTQPRDHLGRWRATGLPADIPTEVVEPTRPPSVVSDVAVPVLQSLLVAAAAGVVAILLMWAGIVPDADPVADVGLAAGAGFALSIGPMLQWARQTLWRVTTPVLPEPERPAQTTIEVTELTPAGGVQRMRILDLPIDDDRLRQFARAALEGRSLAVHRWAGSTFSRAEYEQLADELQRAGLVTAPRGNQGRQLTAAGRAILRRLAG